MPTAKGLSPKPTLNGQVCWIELPQVPVQTGTHA